MLDVEVACYNSCQNYRGDQAIFYADKAFVHKRSVRNKTKPHQSTFFDVD